MQNQADLAFLLSAPAQRALAELAATGLSADNHLAQAARLRRLFPPSRARALLEQAFLRQRAAAKFSRAEQMYFVGPSLEQASAEAVARHRARRYADLGCRLIADLACGLGGDALALAAVAPVVGVDRRALQLALARLNVAVYEAPGRFMPLQADLTRLPPLPVSALFFDPGRRDKRGRRLKSVRDYRPPLALLDIWRQVVPAMGAKISPGVDYGELPAGAEVEFVSLGGDLKEACLWFGPLHSGVERRATLLPGAHTLTDGEPEAPAVTGPVAAFLYEPDSAVIRAHLVRQLAARLGAHLLDATIAYLAAPDYRPSPFARAYAIQAHMPFQLKRLRQYLRQRGIGRVVIKKRGSPLEPDELRHQLRLTGAGEAVLFLTRVQGQPVVLIGAPVP